MLGTGHRLVSANITLALSQSLHADARTTIVVTLSSIPFSAGKFSPDMDNKGWVKRIFGHRRILHWWGLPWFLGFTPLIYFSVPYIFWGPVLGWTSHLFPADFIFGKGGRDIPKGIPLGPFRRSKRLGLGIRVTGKEKEDGSRDKHGTLELITTGILSISLILQIIYYIHNV